MLKIRLRQMGRTNRLMYRLVVADSRSPRDGKYLAMVGSYNPHIEGAGAIHVVEDQIQHWLDKGAQLTVKAEKLVACAAPSLIKTFKEKRHTKKLKQLAKKKKSK